MSKAPWVTVGPGAAQDNTHTAWGRERDCILTLFVLVARYQTVREYKYIIHGVFPRAI